jgi:hypothetical protein
MVTKVEMVTVVFDNALSVPLEECFLREGARNRAAHPYHLGLEPEAGLHADIANVLDHALEAAIGEPDGGGRPLADARPPIAAIVVPAGVDAEVLGAGGGSSVDEGQ